MSRLTSTVAAATFVKAARDLGDLTGDRERKTAVKNLVAQANALLEASVGGKYPEAEEAAKAVQGVAELMVNMDRLASQLKAAPAASQEASQAQQSLNAVRLSIDAMLMPLQASLSTMETLLLATLEIEEQFEALQARTQGFEENLKQARARVAAIAAAVKSTVAIG